MIILQKLTWDNCFSYGEGNELDLSSSTLTQLVGTNGVGKSSIPLILEEVLFNKNSKNVKKADIANRYVNRGYDISLSFTVDSDDYNISVSRRSTLKCKLTKNGEDISSHTASNTYKTLGEILGIDFKTFSQLVYQNTNASLQFLTATDTNRKKFLIDLLKLDEYVSFFETFKEAVRVASSNITAGNAKIATIEKWLEDNFLEDTSLLPKMDLPFQSEDDEKTLSSLQIEFENISEKNKKINNNNLLKQQLESIDLETSKKNLEKYPEELETNGMIAELGSLKAERLAESKMVQKYQALAGKAGAECPTCSQPIDENFIQQSLSEHMEKSEGINATIAEKSNELEKVEVNNEIHRKAARNIKYWEDTFRSIDSGLPQRVLDKESIESEIQTLREKIANTRESLQRVVEENERRERHNTRIGIILEQTEGFYNSAQ